MEGCLEEEDLGREAALVKNGWVGMGRRQKQNSSPFVVALGPTSRRRGMSSKSYNMVLEISNAAL